MKTIAILGGGFAGLSALRATRHSRGIRRVIIDQNTDSEFLPMLPDVVSGRLPSDALRCSLARAGDAAGATFIQGRVSRVDLSRHVVEFEGGREAQAFDALVAATGSVPTASPADAVPSGVTHLSCIEDAERLRDTVLECPAQRWVLGGGGYTAVELAASLQQASAKAGAAPEITIVERHETPCHQLPAGCRTYIRRHLEQRGIRVIPHTSVVGVDGADVLLSGGRRVENARLIWAAGVRAPDIVQTLGLKQVVQQRLAVDEHLQAAPGLFAAGDTAAPMVGDQPLRMSIQAALMGGACAGINARRWLEGRPLRRFRPVDLGFVVPMGKGCGTGRALGVPVVGPPAMLLHYVMCLFRTWQWPARAMAVKALMSPSG